MSCCSQKRAKNTLRTAVEREVKILKHPELSLTVWPKSHRFDVAGDW